MKNTIGLIEFKNISSGIEAADHMVKSAEVELLQASPVCPGKYVIVIGGELAAVNSSMDNAKNIEYDNIVDSIVIGNVSEKVFPALSASVEIKNKNALGIVETFTVASAIEAADTAVKSAVVDLIEVRTARGMGGKCFVLMTGSVADVEAATESGAKRAKEQGLLVNKVVIPNPHEALWEKIL